MKNMTETCSICLDQIESTGDTKTTPCSHTFHTLCLDKWLKKSNSCPYCRKEVIPSSPQFTLIQVHNLPPLLDELFMMRGHSFPLFFSDYLTQDEDSASPINDSSSSSPSDLEEVESDEALLME